MMTSLFSAVSGLKSHQTKMDVIGNNIANVNTSGYKSQSTNFSTLLYQTLSDGSKPNEKTGGVSPKQIGLGVKVSSISTNMGQGAAQRTGNSLDLMINGDNFFVVNNGQENYFTRDGSFSIDALGNLVMSSTGYNVMGWVADEDGNINTGLVEKLQITVPKNDNFKPEYTTKMQLSGLIDKNDPELNSDKGKTISFSFYDNKGYKYTASLGMKRVGNDFNLSVKSVVDEKGINYPGAGFDGDDTFTLSFDEETGEILDTTNSFNFTLDRSTNAAFPEYISVDAKSLVSYDNDGQTVVSFIRGDKDGEGAGSAFGSIQDINVQNDGKIYASYDNGITKCLGQIATAHFANPEGLSKQSDNLYSTTLNSGDFDGVGVSILDNGGYISSGELEMSNVDLSKEFTDMIITQRGYQANARIISVVDTMLEEAVNLKR